MFGTFLLTSYLELGEEGGKGRRMKKIWKALVMGERTDIIQGTARSRGNADLPKQKRSYDVLA